MKEVTVRGRLGAFWGSFVLFCAAFLALIFTDRFRAVEADLAVWVFKHSGVRLVSDLSGPRFYAFVNHPVVFEVSLQCGAGILVFVTTMLAGLFTLSPKFPAARTIPAATLVAVMMVTVNQIRIRTIGLCVELFGYKTGFPLGHYLIGSIVALIGLGASIMVFLKITTKPVN